MSESKSLFSHTLPAFHGWVLGLALPSHREQSNVGLCASFMAELGGLSYMKE